MVAALSLVTQPMLQRQPNRKELRSMDSYIQILCRFQKCKQKVPPPSLLSNEKSPFKTVEELFAYIFGIYIKFGYKNPSILTPSNSVDVAT